MTQGCNFNAEFVVTEKCNLKCPYCYMECKNTEMSLDIFKAHLEFLPTIMKEMNSSRGYSVSFFGGEPLMNFTLIEQATELLARDHNCTSMLIPTNGLLLTKEIVEWSKRNKVYLSWSFDGLWHHNPDEIDKFKKIRELLPKHTCKAMIAPKRSRSLAENYVWFFEEMNMPFVDFSIVRDDIWNADDVATYKVEINQLADLVIEINKSGRLAFPAPFSLYMLDTLVGKKFGKRNFGCFSGCSGAAFMPDGKVYPCARYGSKGGYILFDSLKKEKFFKNLSLFENVTNPIKTTTNPCEFTTCKACELYQYCNAGCTYSQHDKTTDTFAPVPAICELFRATYEQTYRIIDVLKSNTNFRNYIRQTLKEKSLCL